MKSSMVPGSRLLGLLLTAVSTTIVGCQQPPASTGSTTATAAEPETASSAGVGQRAAPVDVQLARDLTRLDQLCWSILIEANMEMPSNAVHLVVRYDAGGLSGSGLEFTAQTGREAIATAVRAIEGKARPVTQVTVTEAEIFELSDVLVEVERRCWFLRVEKSSNEWAVVAKEHGSGALATTTATARGSGLKVALEEVLKELDRKAASAK